eukprot:CAMPEP_0197725566 /NCGR_PEP_ID=MMETSP1434-20131217/7445_1 /TAXON_ID=265543 /ORGANISM="Minutocellus polymorphus, Strain CCMP3303" /LENGTH=99 /DNA_ID=CAMNT_0043311077 /DNA_START=66 /DNA_END=366 /DNA_ORIENTATION=-
MVARKERITIAKDEVLEQGEAGKACHNEPSTAAYDPTIVELKGLQASRERIQVTDDTTKPTRNKQLQQKRTKRWVACDVKEGGILKMKQSTRTTMTRTK